jgi:hypothetical protein
MKNESGLLEKEDNIVGRFKTKSPYNFSISIFDA